MRVPSGCSKIDKTDIVDKVKGLIFGKNAYLIHHYVDLLWWLSITHTHSLPPTHTLSLHGNTIFYTHWNPAGPLSTDTHHHFSLFLFTEPPDWFNSLILGAVIGDSLGIATNGMTKSQVSHVYGKGPIQFGIDDEGTPFLRDNYRSTFDDK
jgi:hypothetical protein